MHKRNLWRWCFFLIHRFRIGTVGIFYDHKNAFMEYARTCEAIVINYANNQLFVYKKWMPNYRGTYIPVQRCTQLLYALCKFLIYCWKKNWHVTTHVKTISLRFSRNSPTDVLYYTLVLSNPNISSSILPCLFRLRFQQTIIIIIIKYTHMNTAHVVYIHRANGTNCFFEV